MFNTELPNFSAWSTQQSDRRRTQVLDAPARFAEDECKRRPEVRYAKLTDGQGSLRVTGAIVVAADEPTLPVAVADSEATDAE